MVPHILLMCLCVANLAYGYKDLQDDKLTYEETINRSELKKHIDCYLDRVPCSADEQRYKNHALDAVFNSCRFCSPREKHLGHVFIGHMAKEFPDDYKEFAKKYDPDGTRMSDMIKEINKY